HGQRGHRPGLPGRDRPLGQHGAPGHARPRGRPVRPAGRPIAQWEARVVSVPVHLPHVYVKKVSRKGAKPPRSEAKHRSLSLRAFSAPWRLCEKLFLPPGKGCIMAATVTPANLPDLVTQHIRRDFTSFTPEQTVGQALAQMRERPPEGRIIYFYVVDA